MVDVTADDDPRETPRPVPGWSHPDDDPWRSYDATVWRPGDSDRRRRRWRRSRPPGRRTPTWLLVVVVVIAAVVGGGAGAGIALGVSGSATSSARAPLTDPDASLASPPSVSGTAEPSGRVASIARQLEPSVVSINVALASGSESGSGIVIRSDGYILTNNHVVSGVPLHGGTLSVRLHDHPAKAISARIVGRDTHSDLAVIKINVTHKLRAAPLGHSSKLAVGDQVVAIGSPLGLAGTVTSGIVSSLRRPVIAKGEGTDTEAVLDAIQTDAAINPGNSGGPLVDSRGYVVGVNSAIATLGGGFGGQSGSIGVGFAIPVDYARGIAQQLIRTGHARHPVIGVKAGSVGNQRVPDEHSGAKVASIIAGGPADHAGLHPGDVITALDGDRVTSVDGLIARIREHDIGATVTVRYRRAGHTHTVRVRLGSDAHVGG